MVHLSYKDKAGARSMSTVTGCTQYEYCNVAMTTMLLRSMFVVTMRVGGAYVRMYRKFVYAAHIGRPCLVSYIIFFYFKILS